MSLMELGMLLSVVLVSLVAGIVLSFAVVVMPGIRSLNDREFLQAFKAMDRVIQRNHPVFMLVWLGAILAVLFLTGLGLLQLEGLDQVLLIAACAIYILGVIVPTAMINIPLNNELQKLRLKALSEKELRAFRHKFEPIWNRWNKIRTVVATVTAVVLLVVLVRI